MTTDLYMHASEEKAVEVSLELTGSREEVTDKQLLPKWKQGKYILVLLF